VEQLALHLDPKPHGVVDEVDAADPLGLAPDVDLATQPLLPRALKDLLEPGLGVALGGTEALGSSRSECAQQPYARAAAVGQLPQRAME
jgi:hypothetical protein